MSKNKFSGNISGKGYYIALILCAVAIGISGYLYYRNANEPSAQLQEPVADTVDVIQQDVPAAATRPLEDAAVPTQPTEPAVPETPKTGKRMMPVSGEHIAEYAVDCLSYNQTTRDWRTHNGIDIAAEAGTKVCAVADGTVYTVFEDDAMGTTVVIRHEGGYTTTYSSLDAKVSIATGDTVTAGQTIGTVGNTALLESAMGEHLHFSVSCNGKYVDPVQFLGQ